MSDVDRRLDEIEEEIASERRREAELGEEIEAEDPRKPRVQPDHPDRGVI